jgi:hypothetical protein
MLLLGVLQMMHCYGYELDDKRSVQVFKDVGSRAYLVGWPWVVSPDSN